MDFLQILMEGILNGVNGRDVIQTVISKMVIKVSHELVTTQNQRGMGKPVRSRDLGLPTGRKNVGNDL